MIGFVLNPPGAHRRRRTSRRARRNPARAAHKTSKAAMRWKKLVARFGVQGAAKRRASRRAAARKAHRAIRLKMRQVRRKAARKVVVPMARRKRSRKARRVVRRRVRRAGRRVRRSRKMRRNPVVKTHRRRRARRHGRRAARRVRRNPFGPITGRRAARRAWRVKPGRRVMARRARKNVRKALNKRFGIRKWVKHSRAKWNPGTALSVGGVGKSITSVFTLSNLYDGLAIGGGIIGALALPRVVDRFIPAGLKSRLPLGISLTTGWFSYIASAAASGLLGYVVGWALGRRYGEKVFWGGIGATVAKLVLDYVTPIRSFTGVGLSAYDSSLQKVIEAEVARELQAGGQMASYVSPDQVAAAMPLGDYATPEGALTAGSLGEFSEDKDFDA